MKEIKTPASGAQQMNPSAAAADGEKKNINAELWQSCAGPLVNLATSGTHVVYFPQGHSEQVAASMRKDMDAQIPNYPNLPSKLLCLLHSVTLNADPETDEVYAQMTLQPVHSFDKDALLRSDLSMKINKPQTDFFCKTLTASDTSTHGGFSVPRRAAEKIFPPLDFTMQPPAQEIVARDLHDNIWSFRHIYRGQPKRHLLTTGWSLFVSGKRLLAGDSVLFIRGDKQQLLLGIRRAHRQPTNLPSSVLSSDSMHIGILAAAAHAAANNSPFTVFYNPRTSPSEFIIPLAKYYKATCSNQISLGMRFRMMFETEESGTRRFMGTITGISDLDPIRWKNSQWRNLQIGWDESTMTGDRRSRVSIWEIEPVTAPFFICPTPSFFSAKRPRLPGMPDDDTSDLDNLFRKKMPWLGDEFGLKGSQPGLSLAQWINMQQNPSAANSIQTNYLNPMPGASAVQNLPGLDITRQPGLHGNQIPLQNNLQFNGMRAAPVQPIQHLEQHSKLTASTLNTLGSITTEQQQLADITQPPTQNFNFPAQFKSQFLQSQTLSQGQNALQQQQSLANNIHQSNLSQKVPQMPILCQSQPHNIISSQSPDHGSLQSQVAENQMQIQLLQKLHMQQQSMLSRQAIQDQQKLLADIQPTFARSMLPDQITDSSQGTSRSVQPQSQPQQMTRNDRQMNLWFSQQSQQSKLQQPGVTFELPGHVGQTWNATSNPPSAGSNSLLTGTAVGGVQSGVTDDVPSCSTSPSTNNSRNAAVRTITNERIYSNQGIEDEIAQSSTSLLNSGGLETISSIGNLGSDLHKKADATPRFDMSSRGSFASHVYANDTGTHVEYLDGISSATSPLSHNEVRLPPSSNSLPFNCESMLFRDTIHDGECLGDPRSSMPSVSNIDSELDMHEPLISNNVVESSKDFSSHLFSAGGVLSGYDNSVEAQPELSSSVVSQSFGVPDMGFNSVDATMNDGCLMNKGSWASLQIPRMRTYTKVYKRGAVGRSIDITRYSGYDELKQDLARRFGIEGQLEDVQRVGWKLVYVDHENDVLLVGDDPWEEFVSCVRCIKILSPQEVQQMSLEEGDFGNSSLQNQACSSSDNGMI